jgi:small membrane protein
MIIKFILSAGLAGCLFYVISLGRANRMIRLALFGVVLTGLVFVWFPEITSRLAVAVGVGRGADLIMYVWIVLNLLLILRLHIRLREQSEMLTLLVRGMALNEAGEQLPSSTPSPE